MKSARASTPQGMTSAAQPFLSRSSATRPLTPRGGVTLLIHLPLLFHLALLLVLAAMPQSGQAEEPAQPPPSSPKTPPLILMPDSAIRSPATVLEAGRILKDQPMLAMPLEPWLDPVRLGLWRDRLQTSCSQEEPTQEPHSVTVLLDRAESSLNFLRYDKLGSLLDTLSGQLPCTTERLSRAQLARILMLKGIRAHRQGLPAERFVDALAIDPTAKLPGELPEAMQTAWQRARQEADARPLLTVALELEETSPWVLWIDGQPAAAGLEPLPKTPPTLRLKAGPHFLQWISPEGVAMVSAWAELTAAEPAAPNPAGNSPEGTVHWPPPDLRPATRADFHTRLLAGLEPTTPDLALNKQLVARALGHDLLVLQPTATGQAIQGILLDAQGPRPMPSRAPTTRCQPPGHAPWLLAKTLGGLTASSLASYWFLSWLTKQDDDLSDTQQFYHYGLAVATGWSSSFLAVGTGVSVLWGFSSSRSEAQVCVPRVW